MAVEVQTTTAVTYLDCYSTASKPAIFKCNDGERRVVKAQFAGRGVAADCALASIGHVLAAPMPETSRVNVEAALIAAETKLQNVGGGGPMQPGIWHGSQFIDGIHSYSNKRDDNVRTGAHNADRFGRLALFFAWCGSGDRQFVYTDDQPNLVSVVDAGHALPGANGWTADGLDNHAAAAPIPADLLAASGYGRTEASAVLDGINPVQAIARAAARPLDHWGGITIVERIALAHYLSRQFVALQHVVAVL